MEIVGYENYLIYPDGKVYNKERKRYLNPNTDIRGYKRVNLHIYKDKKICMKYIHRLVAEHYISNPENKREVDHINRITTDNRIENLRWATRTENTQNTGIYKTNKSGHKNISYVKRYNKWKYDKHYRGKLYRKIFKTKKEALCYKYIFILKIKAGLV